MAKKAVVKNADEVKADVKEVKAEVKETSKKAKKTSKTEAKAETKTATKKAPAKKAVKTTVYVQYAGIEKSVDDIVAAAKAAATVSIKDLTVYVKPEDNAAYYVVNSGEETGKIEL